MAERSPSAPLANRARAPRASPALLPSAAILVVLVLLASGLVAGIAAAAVPAPRSTAPLSSASQSPLPILSFTAQPNPSEVGVPSKLAVTILGNITLGLTFAYAGLPAGCVSQSLANLTCTPTAAGTFDITVTVTSLLGLVAQSLNWTIAAALGATVETTALSSPLAVQFVGAATGGVALDRIQWEFGDGTGASGSLSVDHTFAAAGTYLVTLELLDELGISAVARDNVTLSLPADSLVAVAADSIGAGLAPLNVTFEGSASGGTGPYAYSWTFGDGSAGLGATVAHTYSASGSFVATLTVTDADSTTAQASLLVVVLPTIPPFAAEIAANVTAGTSPLSVTFDGSAQGGVGPFTYLWAFGDGSATATGSVASHTYTAPGAYVASLTVTDSASTPLSTSAEVTIVVGAPSGALFASATATVTEGAAPLLTSFAAAAVGGTGPYLFSWNFGDGSSAVTGALAAHLYAAPGTYLATLSVTDAVGDVTTAHAEVTATSTAPDTLSVLARTTITSGVAPLRIGFQAVVSGGVAPYGYLWSFGDGATSVAASPSYEFSAAGSYTTSVVVTDASGATALAYVNVQVEPSAGLSVGATAQLTSTTNRSVTVAFLASADGGTGPYQYAWSFTNASVQATVADPSFSFASSGDFSIHVTATDAIGATGTYDLNLVVALGGLLVFGAASAGSAASGLSWNFNAATVGGTGPYSYTWDFGDGSAAGTGAVASHTFAAAGTYLVVVTATDSAGHSTEHDLLVSVSPSSGGTGLGSIAPWIAIAAAVGLAVAVSGLVIQRRTAAQRVATAREAASVAAADSIDPDRFEETSPEKDALSDMF